MARGVESINPRLVDQHMRIVLPKNIADALHVKRGDHVAFVIDGHEIKLRKVRITLD